MANLKITQFLATLRKQVCGINFIVYFQTLKEAFGILPVSSWERIANRRAQIQDCQAVQILQDADVLIPADTDEFHAYQVLQANKAHNYSTIKSRILVTDICDNDCLFCIKKLRSQKKAVQMTIQTAKRLVSFYSAFIARKRPKVVLDIFLGGEPFLNYPVMLYIVQQLHAFCSKMGIQYTFIITTNLKNVTAEYVQELLQYGLESLHGSIAGPADVHDRLRPSANGDGNYHLVMKVLRSISHLVPIHIEYQYDTSSRDYLRIGEMNDDFMSARIRIAGISASPIMPRRENNLFDGGAGDPAITNRVNGLIHDAGYPLYGRPPSMMCIVDMRFYRVFLADGRIAGCSSMDPSSAVDARHFVCGHVDTGIDFLVETQQMKRHYPDRCKSCALLPLCGGGCRYMASIYHGDPSAVMCYHDHLQAAVESYLDHRAETELRALERSGGLDRLIA